jgi:hypothetical protein
MMIKVFSTTTTRESRRDGFPSRDATSFVGLLLDPLHTYVRTYVHTYMHIIVEKIIKHRNNVTFTFA